MPATPAPRGRNFGVGGGAYCSGEMPLPGVAWEGQSSFPSDPVTHFSRNRVPFFAPLVPTFPASLVPFLYRAAL